MPQICRQIGTDGSAHDSVGDAGCSSTDDVLDTQRIKAPVTMRVISIPSGVATFDAVV
jgi:hypothetical protein